MNLKLHILASGLFLLLIAGALFVFGGWEDRADTSADNPAMVRFIQVSRAGWGVNCNRAMALPEPVRDNNVLRAVSSLCNGKEQCRFAGSPGTFGFDPAKHCRKILEVEYRCFEIDRSRTVVAEGNAPIVIDCREEAK